MKLKIGALIIIVSTAVIIGVMNLALEKMSGIEKTSTTKNNDQPQEVIKLDVEKKPKAATGFFDVQKSKKEEVATAPIFSDAADDGLPLDANTDGQLSKEDIQKINSIVSLSETDLARELTKLKDRIEQEDIYAKLEDGLLSEEKEVEAKEMLERFALLGLEGTRRKYLAIEPDLPELKNPLYAYKDSLMEIRALLNDDFDDDDDD